MRKRKESKMTSKLWLEHLGGWWRCALLGGRKLGKVWIYCRENSGNATDNLIVMTPPNCSVFFIQRRKKTIIWWYESFHTSMILLTQLAPGHWLYVGSGDGFGVIHLVFFSVGLLGAHSKIWSDDQLRLATKAKPQRPYHWVMSDEKCWRKDRKSTRLNSSH